MPTVGLPGTCPGAQFGSTLVKIPAPLPRVAPRHLFDLSVGDDNLFRGDKYKWSLQLTAINLTNQRALYNFLSTFTGNALRYAAELHGGVGLPFLNAWVFH